MVRALPGAAALAELCMLHAPSGTLALTDLAMNFGAAQRARLPLAARLYLGAVLRRPCAPPASIALFLLDDPPALADALRQLVPVVECGENNNKIYSISFVFLFLNNNN